MPVIEYMFQLDYKGKKIIPGFVKDRGQFYNAQDETYLGWLDSDRDYWVPDTIEVKTKQDCINRALAMHLNNPYQEHNIDDPSQDPVDMDSAQVTTMIGNWYDHYVTRNGG